MKTHPRNLVPLALAMAALVLNLSVIQPAQAASFTETSPLKGKPSSLTATLLPNGKVLVAGVAGNGAQIYDPATGRWTATGTMTTSRLDHTATLLPNGKVLVAGGRIGDNSLSSAEMYDPNTGLWMAVGALTTKRDSHTATLLPDGKVLVAGGQGSSRSYYSAELYDPATETWTATGSLTTARRNHTATLLPNGKVLVAGGPGSISDTELYDPATGLWTATGALTTGRLLHTATLLPNGKVLVAAGLRTVNISSAELYDPATGRWTTTGALNNARHQHTATLLPNGNVLVAGGYASGRSLSGAELYDPNTGTWTATGALNTARKGHTATLLPNGEVLVAGGWNDISLSLSSAELYDPATGGWMTTGAVNTARYHHTAALLPNGKVLVAGGAGSSGILTSAELFDPATGTWTATGTLSGTRASHTATLLPNGKVLVAGGAGSSGGLSSAELYDPATGTWTATSALTTARKNHTATLLPNGKVLVAGGTDGSRVFSSAELYDPATGTWTETGALNSTRYRHTATLLPNGRVLVAGGAGSGGALSSTELYDPATGMWAATAALATACQKHTATLLPNGKVLVAGGEGSSQVTKSTELYDPGTGTWTPAGVLTSARDSHTATLLPSGKVLVAGGENTGGSLSSAELYDPATGTWTATGALSSARRNHTATLLPNGKTLIAGGLDSNGSFLSSAELYDIGLGFSASWQPQIATFTSPISRGGSLTLTGSRFRGVSGGSGGNSQDSPGDYPVVQLRSVESGQTLFLLPTNWSASSFTSVPVRGLPPGYSLVTVFVNGIPSSSILLLKSNVNASVSLGNLSQAYDGTAKSVSVTTTPLGLSVYVTYDGSPNAPTDAGSYTVIGTIDDVDYFGSATNTLVVTPVAPAIVQQPLSQAVEAGTNVTLNVVATGGALNYEWFKNGVAISNATQATLTFNPVALSDAGNYLVVVSNTAGSATSSNAVLAVRLHGAPIIRVDSQLVVGSVTKVGSSTVTMESGFSNGVIYYTLDGSTPNPGSRLYSAAIVVSNTTVVRALGLDVDTFDTAEAPAVTINIVPTYPLTLTTRGNGTVAANPSPGPYTNNTVVSLIAMPNSGWVFDHWSGDISGGANPSSVTINGPQSVQAVFVQLYPVTARTAGGGTAGVSPAEASYRSNTVVSVSATASNGWTFLRWEGDAGGTENPVSLTVNGPKSVSAVFGTTVGTSVIGSGVIELSATDPVAYGTVVQATAVPNSGSYFVQWGSAFTGTNSPTEFAVVSPNPVVRAVFGSLQAGQAALSVRIIGPGSVNVTPRQQVYAMGDRVTLTATPLGAAGQFNGWSGDVVSAANPLALTLNASKVVTANFSVVVSALQITRQGINVQLSWPTAYSNYVLVGSDTLTGGTWVTNTSPQTITGGNIMVTLPTTNSQMFYRLTPGQ